MTLQEIIPALHSLPYQNPLVDTNIEAIETIGTRVAFKVEDLDLQREIENLRAELKIREREIEDAQDYADGWKSRFNKAQDIITKLDKEIAELKDKFSTK